MQEEILINKSRTGTTIHFFNTDINENNYSTSTIPAIINLASINDVPIIINSFDGVYLTGDSSSVMWKRSESPSTNFVYDNIASENYTPAPTSAWPNSNYISGRTFSQVVNYKIDTNARNVIKNNFIASMDTMFTAGTITYVYFEDTIIDDLYANVKLEKTFDVLDTLNIYNKVTGVYPIRESTVGVVFGKLEAIQKLSDENGNRLRIPLRNVPIGIFIQSNDFETQNDMDSEGNRIRLNYRPLSSTVDSYPTDYTDNYFNIESASFDNDFLKDVPLDGLNLHPTFSNVVYTNENGEFILHNVPIGPQILFFEVDLLKQGLTKDEVALNYFPYPPNYENISIDTIPHYFYRAIPIDVVPSWGDTFQTGYTEVDISVNLDLRKWATYIFPPVTYKKFEINSSSYQAISNAPLSIQVRDMSTYNAKKISASTADERLEVYPSKGIQLVEIQNIIDKKDGQQWEWANEFSQIKDKALFYNYGYHAIKLPANIYDADGYKRDSAGIPIVNSYSKGVWLSGYQLKMYLTTEQQLYRTTGLALNYFQHNSKSWYDRDHFHCCLYDNIDNFILHDQIGSGDTSYMARAEGIGKFPYEKAWSKSYPEKYSIPQKPTQENFNDYADYVASSNYLETPRFNDGDIIFGNSYNGFNGCGLSWNANQIQYTDFATNVIGGVGSDMYKYEPSGMGQYGVNSYFGCYANGYNYHISGMTEKNSFVLNPENYQRLEAGYGYFLFPSSLPRVITFPWYYDGFMRREVDNTDFTYEQEISYTDKISQEYDGGGKQAIADHYHSFSVKNNGKSIAMDLSRKNGPNPVINDKLNIYRILDSSRLSNNFIQPTVRSSSILEFGGNGVGYYSLIVTNDGEIDVRITDTFYHNNNNGQSTIMIINPTATTYVNKFDVFVLSPGGQIVINNQQICEFTKSYQLPITSPADIQFIASINQNIISSNINNGVYTIIYRDIVIASDIISYSSLNLPGNAEYNNDNNIYSKCKYKISITVNNPISQDTSSPFVNNSYNVDYTGEGVLADYSNNGHIDLKWYVDAHPSPSIWYTNSQSTGTDNTTCNNKRFGVNLDDFNSNSNPSYYNLWISQTKEC